MIERQVVKQGLSVLYQIIETPGAIKNPQISDILAVGRICQALKDAIGENPRGKGPEVPVVGPDGKVILDDKGKPKTGRMWKVDYPKNVVGVLKLESTDYDILLKTWDDHDKSRFLSDEEMRDWCVQLDSQLRNAPVPGGGNRAERRKRK